MGDSPPNLIVPMAASFSPSTFAPKRGTMFVRIPERWKKTVKVARKAIAYVEFLSSLRASPKEKEWPPPPLWTTPFGSKMRKKVSTIVISPVTA